MNHHRMDQFSGRFDVMLGKLQEKFNVARYKTTRNFDRRRLDRKPGFRLRRPGSRYQ